MKMKIRIEKELAAYVKNIDKLYPLNELSPLLFKNIKEFICRDGKRVRPVLFCIGYLGFSKKIPPGLYRSALSLELLHDFMLVHDDIIDNSDTRRGAPSMHVLLNRYLRPKKKAKFNGEDLTIVAGDVMYAMGLDAFLSVKENMYRKEAALKKLISAVLYTGSGEFIELLLGIKPLEKTTQKDIYKIYDYKTAHYTFATPLTMGATLAGAKTNQIKRLLSYGLLLGRAFQIKDDIIGTFGEEKRFGKSNLTDIKEAKRTLLIWYAFNHADKKGRKTIKKIMEGESISNADLLKMRKLITDTGALAYAKNQIKYLFLKSKKQIYGLNMIKRYKQTLDNFSQEILKT
ncbi:MAG: polyprenyl synthetase family protein [Candidatus Omnitrophica bacterium]|nr:polyprenyl synthetase family protein [Candidatus Omnitrophota bacterium]MBU1924121.1 polyprenyl synthetase family protein [Candidatus Omnitrophota bacterium]